MTGNASPAVPPHCVGLLQIGLGVLCGGALAVCGGWIGPLLRAAPLRLS